jgi:hypothetical protein
VTTLEEEEKQTQRRDGAIYKVVIGIDITTAPDKMGPV